MKNKTELEKVVEAMFEDSLLARSPEESKRAIMRINELRKLGGLVANWYDEKEGLSIYHELDKPLTVFIYSPKCECVCKVIVDNANVSHEIVPCGSKEKAMEISNKYDGYRVTHNMSVNSGEYYIRLPKNFLTTLEELINGKWTLTLNQNTTIELENGKKKRERTPKPIDIYINERKKESSIDDVLAKADQLESDIKSSLSKENTNIKVEKDSHKQDAEISATNQAVQNSNNQNNKSDLNLSCN